MPRAAAGTMGKASPFPELLEELVVSGGETNSEPSGQNTPPSNKDSNEEEVAKALSWLSSAPSNVAAPVPLDIPAPARLDATPDGPALSASPAPLDAKLTEPDLLASPTAFDSTPMVLAPLASPVPLDAQVMESGLLSSPAPIDAQTGVATPTSQASLSATPIEPAPPTPPSGTPVSQNEPAVWLSSAPSTTLMIQAGVPAPSNDLAIDFSSEPAPPASTEPTGTATRLPAVVVCAIEGTASESVVSAPIVDTPQSRASSAPSNAAAPDATVEPDGAAVPLSAGASQSALASTIYATASEPLASTTIVDTPPSWALTATSNALTMAPDAMVEPIGPAVPLSAGVSQWAPPSTIESTAPELVGSVPIADAPPSDAFTAPSNALTMASGATVEPIGPAGSLNAETSQWAPSSTIGDTAYEAVASVPIADTPPSQSIAAPSNALTAAPEATVETVVPAGSLNGETSQWAPASSISATAYEPVASVPIADAPPSHAFTAPSNALTMESDATVEPIGPAMPLNAGVSQWAPPSTIDTTESELVGSAPIVDAPPSQSIAAPSNALTAAPDATVEPALPAGPLNAETSQWAPASSISATAYEPVASVPIADTPPSQAITAPSNALAAAPDATVEPAVPAAPLNAGASQLAPASTTRSNATAISPFATRTIAAERQPTPSDILAQAGNGLAKALTFFKADTSTRGSGPSAAASPAQPSTSRRNDAAELFTASAAGTIAPASAGPATSTLQKDAGALLTTTSDTVPLATAMSPALAPPLLSHFAVIMPSPAPSQQSQPVTPSTQNTDSSPKAPAATTKAAPRDRIQPTVALPLSRGIPPPTAGIVAAPRQSQPQTTAELPVATSAAMTIDEAPSKFEIVRSATAAGMAPTAASAVAPTVLTAGTVYPADLLGPASANLPVVTNQGKPRPRNSQVSPVTGQFADSPSTVPLSQEISTAVAPPIVAPAASAPPAASSKPSTAPSGNPQQSAPSSGTATFSGAPSEADDNAQPQQASRVAFTVTLKPADTAPETVAAAAALKPLPSAGPKVAADTAASVSANPENPENPEEPIAKPATATAGKQPDTDPQSSRKDSDNGAPAVESNPANHMAANPMIQMESQPAANSSSTEHAAPSEPTTPATPAQTEPAPAPVHGATVQDIKLQVGGEGDRHVEVRVTEHGGDVIVAVRTPDAQLAGDLRQELPSLAMRLEQSGFHATTWQPAADSERQRLADPQAGASGQDAQGQPRQNGREQQRGQQQQKQQEPEIPANPSQPKEPGKDFERLLSSIR